ncbi:hypothetical protein Mapa_003981 [Marchantia paleacea]|nr:hypothetical protein Mapa_003981 [Marchantia paleacea]
MCGRARCTIRVEDVGRATGYRAPLHSVDSDRYRPSYNVAPGRYMPVVRQMQAGEATEQCSTEAVVHCMKWGLIPSFTKKNEKPDHFRMRSV